MFENVYEEDHPVQKAWDSLQGSCLCGRSEWCSNCDGSRHAPKNAILELANSLGYQLYYKGWRTEEYEKLDMGIKY